MRKYFIIIQSIVTISIVLGQTSELKTSDYDQFYPSYFDAITAAAEGDFTETLPAFNTMINQFPNHMEAILFIRVCQDAIEENISNQAAKFFFKALDAQYNLAESDEIMFLFDQALKKENKYLPFLLIRANYFASEYMYELALADYSTAIQLEPKAAIGYYSRGKLYLNNQMNMQAFSDFNKTIKLNPNYSAAYAKRAVIYVNMKENVRALNDFEKAYSIDSTSIKSMQYSSILNNMATDYIEQEKFDYALQALNFAILADNRWHEPFLNRGIVHKSLNNFSAAILDLNKAIELKPQSAKPYYNRGIVFKEKKEYGNAKFDLLQSLQYKDLDVHTYFLLAEISSELNEYTEATKYYKIALKEEPQNIWAYYQLAGLYDRRRGFKEAVKYYDEFVKLASNEYFTHKIKAKDRSDRIKKYLKQQDNINQQ